MGKNPLDMATELDDPNIEVEGVMAEQLAAQKQSQDEPQAQADEQAQGQEAQQTAAETPNAQTTQPQAQQPQTSFLTTLEDDSEAALTEEPQNHHAPVSGGIIRDLQKERQKRQQAEQEAAELRQRLETQSQQQVAEQIDLSETLKEVMSGNEDDYVDAKTLATVVNKVASTVAQQTRQSVMQEIGKKEQLAVTQQQKEQRKQRMLASEDQIRKVVSDYDSVVDAAINTGSLSKDEIQTVLNAPNPAAALYRKSKEILNVFGIQPNQQQNQSAAPKNNVVQQGPENQTLQQQTPGNDEIQDDEAFVQSVFGPRRGG